MDFHSLSRKELQSLCKLNKIPANITNVAMADALQSLQIVVGIEDFLNASHSETADLGEKVEVPSPKAPQTRCRTSTRQKVKKTEIETLPLTVSRTTRRGSKQLPTDVEDSKNNLLQTPAVSSRRNVSYRLNDCENEAKEENKYSTRRSTRLTEKKSAATRVKKEVKKAVEIDSFLDLTSKELEEVPVETEVEDICNAFEKLDVLVVEEEVTHKSEEEEEEDCNNLKQESHEHSNLCEDGLKISEVKNDEVSDVKPESDGISNPSEEAANKSGEEEEEDVDSDEVSNNQKQELHEISNSCEDLNISEVKTDVKQDLDHISSPCEDEILMQKLDIGDSLASAMKEHNHVLVQEENSDSNDISIPFEDENLEKKLDNINMSHVPSESSTMVIDDTENPIDEIATKEIEEMSENQTVDAIPMDYNTMSKETEDLKPNDFTANNATEKSEAESGPTQDPLIFHEATGHKAHMTPVKKATVLTVVSDDKENIVDEGKVRKEKDDVEKIKSFNEISIRQLKKQLKALTLKNLNSKEEAAATTRPALQALCENQMVVGAETEN